MSKEKSKIFETVLSSPGMNQKCKINLNLSRQQVLLLCRLIEIGLLTPERSFQDGIIEAIPNEAVDGFNSVHEEILNKADLREFYDRIKMI